MQRVPHLRTALARPTPALAPLRWASTSARTTTAAPAALVHASLAHPGLAAALARRVVNPAAAASPLVRFRTFHPTPTSRDSRPDTGQSSSSSSSQGDDVDTGKIPLTQRIKYLFRKHGWTALVVYLLLSAVDFGLCFVVIYAVGADRVRQAEDWVLDTLGWRRKHHHDDRDGDEPPGRWQRAVEGFKERRREHAAKHVSGADAHPSPAAAEAAADDRKSTTEVVAVERSAAGGSGYQAYATTAVLAYAVHKTLLLPFRVGVTMAITPRVVRTLQGWGWRVGMAAGAPPTAQSAAAAKAAKEAAKKQAQTP
ncbi:Nat2p [Rhodotorula paludigena]|uniref:Nat2p n=1 Tax=Rhodotorula paludigena TaxID=86838 RepID=UPI00316E0E2E